jgi:hypothetical protein
MRAAARHSPDVWVAQVGRRREALATYYLQDVANYEVYAPRVRQGGRVVPLFPSYLFLAVSPRGRRLMADRLAELEAQAAKLNAEIGTTRADRFELSVRPSGGCRTCGGRTPRPSPSKAKVGRRHDPGEKPSAAEQHHQPAAIPKRTFAPSRPKVTHRSCCFRNSLVRPFASAAAAAL